MPAFSLLPAQSINDLMAFLTRPDLAPPGSAPATDSIWFARTAEQLHIPWLEDLIPSIKALVTSYSEPPYPKGVAAPPSRYRTGYGN
jgi:hypothetical protein